MKKDRQEELAEANAIINTLLTLTLTFLTFIIALSNPSIYVYFPATAFIIPIVITAFMAISLYVLFKMVWK